MGSVTPAQIQARDAYLKFKNVKKASKHLGIRRASLMEHLAAYCINANLLVNPGGVPNPFQIENMFTERSTTKVDFNNGVPTMKTVWYKDKKLAVDPEQVFEYLKTVVPAVECNIVPPQNYSKDHLMEVVVSDAHIGALCWKLETRDENYDLKIAQNLYTSAVTENFLRSGNVGTTRLVFLGDTMHTDGLEALTPASKHPLDVESRFQKMLDTSIEVICQIIFTAVEYSNKVEVLVLRGNHDETASIGLQAVLKAYFRNVGSVIVDANPALMRYKEFGVSGFAYAHGHKTTLQRLANETLAYFARKHDSKCEDFYVKRGHLHHYEFKDIGSVMCETMPTLFPRDSFAAEGNWLSKRAMLSSVYHKDAGLVNTYTITPRSLNYSKELI